MHIPALDIMLIMIIRWRAPLLPLMDIIYLCSTLISL